MSIEQVKDRGRFSDSLFPVRPVWEAPRSPWHQGYPSDVPPALEFDPLRVEQLLIRATERFPDRMAVRYYRTNWRYHELVERIQRAAANFQRLGVQTGDRVLMVLPNCPDYVVAWFALHWLGAEVVPANPLLAAKDLVQMAETAKISAAIGLDVRAAAVFQMTHQYRVPLLLVSSLAQHLPFHWSLPYRLKCWMQKRLQAPSHTRVCSTDELYRGNVEPIHEPLLSDPSLPAVLQPTGGTTGTPKIAVLTHKNLHANVAQLHAWCGLNAGEEVVLAVLPFFHVFGSTVAMLSPIAGGATLLLQANFHPKRIWNLMERWKPSVAPMVPFMFATLCEEMKRRGRNIQGLRFCFSGASSLGPDLKEDFERRTGATIFEGYGLSEASPVTHNNPPNRQSKPGSIGVPLPNTEARVVDTESGETEVPPGEVGELVVRGPQVMSGYLDNPAETSQMLRDGWLYTGDLATMDQDGFFTIVDRKKDMIISGGLNVYPAEVEAVLQSHPDVQECAVVGLPDTIYGEKVTAFVVPVKDKHIDPLEIQKHCASTLAGYKVPKTIEVRDELPRTFLGKLRRIDLRSKAA